MGKHRKGRDGTWKPQKKDGEHDQSSEVHEFKFPRSLLQNSRKKLLRAKGLLQRACDGCLRPIGTAKDLLSIANRASSISTDRLENRENPYSCRLLRRAEAAIHSLRGENVFWGTDGHLYITGMINLTPEIEDVLVLRDSDGCIIDEALVFDRVPVYGEAGFIFPDFLYKQGSVLQGKLPFLRNILSA